MKPSRFKHQNTLFAEDQPEYQPLPALKVPNDPNGEVITCWKMSSGERLKVLFTGRVWLAMLTFNKPLTPTFVSVNRDEMFTENEKK